jgi:hypothetical protein
MSTSWVVYSVKIRGRPLVVNAVCERGEWAALERAQPGHFTLVRAGIASEGEAERLARGPDAVDTKWAWARRPA